MLLEKYASKKKQKRDFKPSATIKLQNKSYKLPTAKKNNQNVRILNWLPFQTSSNTNEADSLQSVMTCNFNMFSVGCV